MKVVKFGGSSVASGAQLKKVTEILESDPERTVVVVSAPGKRTADDEKVTDLLIQLGESVDDNHMNGDIYEKVRNRFKEIIDDLDLSDRTLSEITNKIDEGIAMIRGGAANGIDALKACGEDGTALILSAFLSERKHNASYVHPKEAGIFLKDEPGGALVLEESFAHLYELRKKEGILVIPGFFGYTKEGKLITFSRGGSDITGSIVAAGVKADLYENFTDVDSVYCVNPALVKNPKEMKNLTYREMRELSYAGFSVFHDEALIPAFKEKIPVCIKNTNNPEAPGTMIVAEREDTCGDVVGIASDDGFVTIYVSKYLMNREIGFGRRLLHILEDEEVSFEHAPSGIDDMSIILREDVLPSHKEETVVKRIREELQVDTVEIERNMAMIMIVGEGMNQRVGVASKATRAFEKAGVNLEMINQGSSEVSMMFGIHEDGMEKSVQELYKMYFS
ncbi:aspartate kinase [Salimicrobium jeotgali]|uniref:Aspartokinase n=1 Tax=Salimicrobium jeotgali TaxID=1230341 RepID=K2G737_9BACI|nr:aspartate kinase [Salimicrobium jeotgali]AKG04342.1 aspartate kinase [Salimicrobium jeotgali]EKE31008.1 aspartate kinase [Salimicrobium jeotgali]MBM7697446.1 aspartate kinase [Salimicrobium jeotgali]